MKTEISIHDNYRIETILEYPLGSGKDIRKYVFGIFFFIPRSLGVHSGGYEKERFYADLQSYIRLSTPDIPIKDLTNPEGLAFTRLREAMDQEVKRAGARPSSEFKAGIKMFCSEFKGSVRERIAELKDMDSEAGQVEAVAELTADLRRTAELYRRMETVIDLPRVAERSREIYCFGDEFISLLMEDSCFNLISTVKDNALKKELRGLIKEEQKYRRQRDYPSIADPKGDNETLLFRRSVLKKYMASILFLETDSRRDGIWIEQALFGLAAGVAMLFATAVAYLSQSIYGALSYPVFIALVLSYIFKDRLKDLMRLGLSRRIGRRIFDHRINIFNSSREAVGVCREAVEFVPRHKLLRNIADLRNSDHITEIENSWMGEQILLYRKKVELKPRRVMRTFKNHPVSAVTDIMRFNFSEYLRRMDDPDKELFIMDEDSTFRINGQRVYHVNIIIRLEQGGRMDLERWRLVLNRDGIKRLEHVAASPRS